MDLWKSFKKSKKLIIISFFLIALISLLLFFVLKIQGIEPFVNTAIDLVGFIATIYSVLLTILLYHFLSLSEAEFVINSNIYVERNKQLILSKSLHLSNFIKEAIQDIHTNESGENEIIPAEIRADFLYLKNLNRTHINEKTTLYQCKETFNNLEDLIEDTKIHEAPIVKDIASEKLYEIWRVLIELTTNLDTIFNNKE